MSTDRGCVSSIALAKEDGKAHPQQIAGTKCVGSANEQKLKPPHTPKATADDDFVRVNIIKAKGTARNFGEV